jgi:D-arabinose 1-dehydrogenase-like Zn-dependent alcohol dehydrogenase
MAASVYVLKKGGKVVTCAATTGYDIEYDNRYLWMESKSIIGCHFANPLESRKANQLVVDGKLKPFVSSCHPFDESGKAIERFESNQGFGKVVIEVLSEERDPISPFNLF